MRERGEKETLGEGGAEVGGRGGGVGRKQRQRARKKDLHVWCEKSTYGRLSVGVEGRGKFLQVRECHV